MDLPIENGDFPYCSYVKLPEGSTVQNHSKAEVHFFVQMVEGPSSGSLDVHPGARFFFVGQF